MLALTDESPARLAIAVTAIAPHARGRFVRSLGFAACAFASAEEFLQSPRLHDTSCVIADVQMPGMSGVELQSLLVAQGHRHARYFHHGLPRRAHSGASDEGRGNRFPEQARQRANLD